ncbi:MAG TPA: serine/threonine-protein kinase [Chloroflexota bacterium]|nr:serine/threonine-protein kinase [Chloroflexota bacterium]
MTVPCARCGLCHPPGTVCLAQSIATLQSQEVLPAGTLLAGRYAVMRTIHRGGMGVVYLAGDQFLQGQQVVLKESRLPAGASAEDRREAEGWFARESYLLSSLRHPLIPRFYSVFQEDGRTYIVQEFVAGENLDQVVRRRGSLREDLVVGWGIALCNLLTYLHERDEPVVFRDLKPANILWREMSAGTALDEQPLAVVDFGIARPFRRGEVGTVIGTPGYAPPEQYQGLATPQSDVYALGATLHRLLTDYDPEQGAPFTFPAAMGLNPRVSPEMAAVVERATRLDPAARFQSANEMKLALRRVAAREGYLAGVAAASTAVSPPTYSFRAGWIGPVIGSALLGSMVLSMLGSMFRQPAMSYVPIHSAYTVTYIGPRSGQGAGGGSTYLYVQPQGSGNQGPDANTAPGANP